MKKLLLILVVLTITGYGQTQKTVTPTWVKEIARDSAQTLIQGQDSLQVIDGAAKVYINPDDNYGLQISRPNDDVGIKIKVDNQKTGWIVFENQDGNEVGEIEFDTDGTTETFEIGTNSDYPVIIRSNSNNTVSIDELKMIVDGYITADSVMVNGRKLLKDDFYSSLDEESTPDAVDKLLIIDGTTLKFVNVEDLVLSSTNVDSTISGTATVLFLSDPIVDSIVVTHNVGTTPSINDIQLTPQTDLKGFQYWIENITSTTFEIQMNSDIGFEAMATNPKFTWWVIKRR